VNGVCAVDHRANKLCAEYQICHCWLRMGAAPPELLAKDRPGRTQGIELDERPFV